MAWVWANGGWNPWATPLGEAVGPHQIASTDALYLQVLKGLLRNQFLLLVPLHSVHDTGPQKSNHCCLREVIPLHLFFHVEHHLHFRETGVREYRQMGSCLSPSWAAKVWGKRMRVFYSVPPFLVPILRLQKGQKIIMICSQSRLIFSSKINGLSSGWELLDNRK